MPDFAALSTPALILDEARCRRNCARLRDHVHALGVVMRPHLKTCKNLEIARWCMESPQGPATVSTLAEAEYFAAGGVRDICYAVGIAPDKLPRAAALRAGGTDLILTLDSLEAAQALLAFARERRLSFAVMLEKARAAGQMLFAAVDAIRLAGIDAEEALTFASKAFCRALESGRDAHQTEQ